MLNHFSRVQLFATPWTVAHQARLSLGFSWQEYQIGLPLPPQGNLPKPGIELVYLTFPALADGFFTTGTTWEALDIIDFCYKNTREGHTPREGLVRTQREGGCLQARKRALTRTWRDLHLISDFQPPELWAINVVVWKKGKKGAQGIWYKRLLKHASAVDSISVRISSCFLLAAGFFVSCSHAQAELVGSSGGRFVIWISGTELFTVEYCQASLRFLLSLIYYWQLGGLKHLCPNERFFFSLFCLPSASDTWPPGICCVCSVQRLPAYRQSPGGHVRPEQPWWLSAQSNCWSFGRTLSSDAFFDWINCTNSRSCHI